MAVAFAPLVAGGLTTSSTAAATATAIQLAVTAAAVAIDQLVILPALRDDTPANNSLDGQLIGQSEDGSPGAWCVGAIRVPCVVFDQAPSIDVATGSQGGSKAGPAVNNYEKRAPHLAVAFRRGAHALRGEVLSIDCNGDRIFDTTPNLVVSGSDITITASTGIVQPGTTLYIVRFESPAGGTDLSQVSESYSVTLATGQAPDGSYPVWSAGDNPDGSTFVEVRFVDEPGFVWFTSQPAGTVVTLTQNLPQLKPGVASSVAFYDGSTAGASVDPTLAAFHGGSAPSHAGTQFGVFSDFNLTRYGGGRPQFTAYIRAGLGLNEQGRVEWIFRRAQVPREYLEVEQSGLNVNGGVIWGNRSGTQLLTSFLVASRSLVLEEAGKLKIKRRPTEIEATIPFADINAAAFEAGSFERTPDAAPITSEDEQAIPGQTAVRYQRIDDDGLEAQVRQRRPGITRRKSNRNVNLASTTLEVDEAQFVAARFNYGIDVSRRSLGVVLGPKWLHLTAGRFVRVELSEDGSEFFDGIVERAVDNVATVEVQLRAYDPRVDEQALQSLDIETGAN